MNNNQVNLFSASKTLDGCQITLPVAVVAVDLLLCIEIDIKLLIGGAFTGTRLSCND